MDLRTLGLVYAAGRVAVGTAMAAAPGPSARVWVGRRNVTPGACVITAGAGARDVAIGLGAARALRAGHGAAAWLRAGAFADTVDGAATLLTREKLPASSVIGIGAFALGSAAIGLWLQAGLDQPEP